MLLAFLTRVCLSCALATSSVYDYSNFDAIFAYLTCGNVSCRLVEPVSTAHPLYPVT